MIKKLKNDKASGTNCTVPEMLKIDIEAARAVPAGVITQFWNSGETPTQGT